MALKRFEPAQTQTEEPSTHAVTRSKSRRPLTLVVIWWILCFGLYLTNVSIAYSHRSLFGVTALFAAATACTLVGYRIGAGNDEFVANHQRWKLPKPVIIGFIASIVLIVPMSQAYAGVSVLDVGSAIADQANAYNLASAKVAQGLGARSGIVIAQTVFAPFILASTPFLALAWFEARKHGVLFLIALLAPALLSLVTGRTQQIGTAAIVVGAAWILSLIRRGRTLRWPHILTLSIGAVVLMLAFGAQKLARIAGFPMCVPGETTCRGTNIGLVEGTWVEISSYASQGFEGLGHALDAVWNFGGGFSHSGALESMLAGLFQFQPPAVVTSQLDSLSWSSTGYWSTGFASIANDVPWILVPVVVGFQAVVLGLSWRASVRDADWLSVAVFSYTWLSLLFMPQNLQVAISGPSYLGYLGLLIFYLGRWAGRRVSRSSAKGLLPVPSRVVR